jgi:hypothetical protein
MNVRYLSLVALALVIVFSGCPKKQIVAFPDANVVVARDGSGDYKSIQSALDDADDGDVIYVKAGTYKGGIEIEDLEDIVLAGADPGRTIIDADDDYAALTLDADDCEVYGFTLRDASSHGIYVKDGHHTVRNCLVIGNGDRGIYFSSFSGDPSAEIDHCTVAGNDVSGIYIPNDNEETSITNCIVADNDRGIVTDGNDGGMTVDYNCVYEDGNAFDGVTEGVDNIEEDPGFKDTAGGDFTLAPDSPCIGAASDDTNMGCFQQ